MILPLSVAERFAALQILNGAENLSRLDLNLVFKVIDKISFSEEESAEIKLKYSTDTVTWDVKAPPREIALTLDEQLLLRKLVTALEGKLSVKRDGRHTLTLFDKLNDEN